MSARQVLISSKICPVSNVVSRNRVSVVLSQPVIAPKGYDIGLTVVDAQIPNTWYNCNYTNNKLSFVIYNGSYSATCSYTFPNNQYTQANFITTFKSGTVAGARVFNFTMNGTACTCTLTLDR